MRRVVLILLISGCTRATPSPVAELIRNRPAAVFAFLASDCPLSQSYVLTMNSLQAEFKDIPIYGIVVGEPFGNAYKLDFTVLTDADFKFADFFGATKTPEAFAVDSRGMVFYRGAIDNAAPELGRRRAVITEHYLIDALDSFLQHKPVPTPRTEAVGCFIERKAAERR